MKTVKGFKLRPLGAEFIMTMEGVRQVDFNRMIALNRTAAYLWQNVDGLESFEIEDLANLLTKEYEVDMELALKDSAAIARKWKEAGIVTD